MLFEKNINRFPEYRFLPDSDVIPDRFDRELPEQDLTKDNILITIFAPDPFTGVPRSDLGIVMSKDANPEVADYIIKTLQRPLPGSPSDNDPDFVLESIRQQGETFEAYANRLREIVASKSS